MYRVKFIVVFADILLALCIHSCYLIVRSASEFDVLLNRRIETFIQFCKLYHNLLLVNYHR